MAEVVWRVEHEDGTATVIHKDGGMIGIGRRNKMTETTETPKKEMGRATALRKYYPNLSLQELKAFKVADPDGYEEIGRLCVEHFGCVVTKTIGL